MKFLELIKLKHRANKYKNKDDVGGIAYLIESIKTGDTVLDIGVHKAGYLYWIIKKIGSTGKVVGFEPQTNLFNYVLALKKMFNWKTVTLEHLALSNSVGEVTLFIPKSKNYKGNSPGATIVAKTVSNNSNCEQQQIATNTLDNYCQQHNIVPSFLKIDVEGNELNVFKGGHSIISLHKPKILVEIEARHVGEAQVFETINYLISLGYTAHFIHNLQRIAIDKFSISSHQNLNDSNNYCNNFIFE
jgi:FkbM family methyltransferase